MAVGVTDTKSQSSNITVVFKVIDQATKELNKISSSFSKIDSQVAKTAKASGGAATGMQKFGAAIAKVGIVAAGVVGGFLLAKNALEQLLKVGEEGAAFLQTGESFRMMSEHMNVSTELLQQLRDATQGTIGDMQLMSYATTAMAGATGEFGREIGNALPRLAEIAKAANKANPALGSVDYQFQSLIVGLKRLSPRLIDNTGLQLKLGEAYEKFAQKVGKNADELSSEEQQLALLNATLEAGDRLMAQVGGTAASMTDPFNQFTAAMDNTTNAIKGRMYPALADLATLMANMVTDWGAKQIEQLGATEDQMRDGAKGYEQYSVVVNNLAKDYGFLIDKEGNLIRVRKDGARVTTEVVVASFALTESQYSLAKAVEYDTEKIAHYNKVLGSTPGSMKLVMSEADKLKKKMSDLEYVISGPVTKAFVAHRKTLEELNDEQLDIVSQIEAFGGADWLDADQAEKIAAVRAQLGGVWGQMNDVKKALEDGLGPKKKYAAEQNLKSLKDTAADLEAQLRDMGVTDLTIKPGDFEDIAELKRKLQENKIAINEETAAWKENQKQLMLDMVQRQLFAVLPEGEAISAYADVAEKMGLIDEQTANAYGMVGELSTMFADEKINVKEYADLIATLAGYLGMLPDDVTVDVLVNYTEVGNRPAIGSGGATAGGGGSGKKSQPVLHAVGGYTAANTPAIFHRREAYMPGRSGYTLAENDLKAIIGEMGMTSGGGGNMFYMDFRGSSINNREDVEILAYRVADHMAKKRR